LFVPEKTDNDEITDITAVKIVPTDDEDHVEVARAEYNAKFGGCSEITGVDWAIKDFFQLITDHYEFAVESSGEIGDWVPRK